MVINIPLQIDEQQMQDVIAKDYEGKIIQAIVKYIKTALENKATSYYGDRMTSGMTAIIEQRVDQYLKEYHDEIIEIAGKHLADRLGRTKRAKELLEEIK